MNTRIFPNNFRINRFESKVNFESVLGSFHAFHEFLPDHLKNGQSGNRATADLCNLKKVRLFKRLLPSRISWWPAGVSCRQGSTKRHRRRAARWWWRVRDTRAAAAPVSWPQAGAGTTRPRPCPRPGRRRSVPPSPPGPTRRWRSSSLSMPTNEPFYQSKWVEPSKNNRISDGHRKLVGFTIQLWSISWIRDTAKQIDYKKQ